MSGIEGTIVNFLRDLVQSVGWGGVVVAMLVESVNIPLPSEVTMPLAGWMLIKEQNLPVTWVLVAAFFGALGNTIGSLINYLIGLWGGRPLVSRYGKWILVSHRDLDRADRWFARYGDAIAFFSRLLPVVRTFISLPAGIARMNLGKFLVYTFAGSFIWSGLLAYLGFVAGENWEAIRERMRPFDIPMVVLILLLIAFYVWHKVRDNRRYSNTSSVE